ncbi:TcpE family conjugal transfer membrane protein [Nonomuraea angiospora]|uniref:TcpE family conjugal transfer membrane protein n=1 Tax=Nonomuraea angiospora TaxID=46172 RepID=UPI0033D870AA
MDLPTYTNIWRIEKRLYKLYDLRLPMPLPIVWIGVFVGVFVPWSLLLVLVGVPVEMPWHVLYLVPPGIVTWLSTRPVIEGKRLTELLESQLRYLGQPKAWYRLAPMSEPETITFSGRVWRTTPARAKSKAPRKARQPQRRREGQRIAGPRQVRPAVAAAAAAASQAPVAEPTTGRWGTRRGTAPALKARVRETAPPSAPRSGVGALRREEALPGGPGRRQDALPPGGHESSEPPTREFVDARDAAAWDREDARDIAARDRGDARDAVAWDREDARDIAAWARGDARDIAAWARGDARDAAARERTGRGEAAAALADVGTQEPAAETPGREAAPGARGQGIAGRDGDVQELTPGSPDDARADRGATGAVGETETHKPAAGKPIDTEALRRLRRLAASADAPAEPSGLAESERRDRERDEERPEDRRGEQRGDRRGERREDRPEDRRGEGRGEQREDEVARDQHRKGQPPRLGPSLALSGPQRVWPPLNPDAKPLPRPAATRPGADASDTTSTAQPQQDTAPITRADTPGAPSLTADAPGAPSDEPITTAHAPDAPSTTADTPGAPGTTGTTAEISGPSTTAEISGPSTTADGPDASGDMPGAVGDAPDAGVPQPVAEVTDARGGVDAPGTADDGPEGDAPEKASDVTAGDATAGDAAEMRDDVSAPSARAAAPKRNAPQPVAEAAEVLGGAEAQEPDAQEPGAADARPERSTAERPERSTVRRLVAKGDAPGADVPGTRGDRGAAVPGTRGDRSGSFPGTRGDRGAGVPAARGPAAGDRRVAANAEDGRAAAAKAGDSRSAAASLGDGRGAAASAEDDRGLAASGRDGRGAAASAEDDRGLAASVRDGRGTSSAGDGRGVGASQERGGEFVAPVPVPRPGEGRVRRVESVVGRDSGGWRRIAQVVVGGGGVRTDGSEIDEARARGVFGGSRRIVVLGCTGGAGQSTTALMLGHTFARYRDDRVVAVDANTGGGTLTSKIQPETPETLTSLLSGLDRVSGYLTMRGYTTRTASGLEVISADSDAGAEQRLADRSFFSDHRLGESMRLLDRHYKLAVIDPAAALAARLLPYADQLVLVVPASEEASEAVAMTYEWLDGHGCAELRRRAVMVVNGVSRRSMADVEQAESVARGRCRAIVRVPWEDGLAPEGAEVVDPGQLRTAGKRAYLALAGVVIAGFAAQAQTVRPSEEELASDPPGTRIGER